MMKMMFQAFSKKLFGARYERLIKTLFVYLIVFWGLYTAGFQMQIALSIFYLMVSSFTAGVMWQALSSEDNATNMQNMFMLPFDRRKFVFSYITALGAYTFLTKTAALLAVLLALSNWSFAEAFGGILCAANATLMAAGIFSLKKYRCMGSLWAIAGIAAIFFLWKSPWFLLIATANGILSLLLLRNADGYSFYLHEGENRRIAKYHKRYSVWRYLFRYLTAHKNYLLNMAVMWFVACVLPLFMGRMESQFAIPIGLAMLSLNTPICILLSCDPALEQAVRFLPRQKKAFCVPYCLFLFFCNMVANGIFLCSWQIQIGGITGLMMATAVFIALQSAVFSVLLEWFYPIRNWKIESDLWHHPRKYLVPAAMLLIAGIVGTMPEIVVVLIVVLLIEVIILLFRCQQ